MHLRSKLGSTTATKEGGLSASTHVISSDQASFFTHRVAIPVVCLGVPNARGSLTRSGNVWGCLDAIPLFNPRPLVERIERIARDDETEVDSLEVLTEEAHRAVRP